MKLRKARKFIRKECKRWHVRPPLVRQHPFALDACYKYRVAWPHCYEIMLTKDSTWATVVHELAHHFTYKNYGHTFHGQEHSQIKEDIYYELSRPRRGRTH